MTVRDAHVDYWIEQIAAIQGIEMDSEDLVDDLLAVAEATKGWLPIIWLLQRKTAADWSSWAVFLIE